MANVLKADVRRATTWSIVLSALMILSGVLAIGLPMMAGIAVTALVGAPLFIYLLRRRLA